MDDPLNGGFGAVEEFFELGEGVAASGEEEEAVEGQGLHGPRGVWIAFFSQHGPQNLGDEHFRL